MLNLNPKHKIEINESEYTSFSLVNLLNYVKIFSIIFVGIFVIAIIFLFLPWTQNIRATGNLTTFEPDKRPQIVNSILAGKIEEWYVFEGDYVKKGDTIVYISEVKEDYFNPEISKYYDDQLLAKKNSLDAYNIKIDAINSQQQVIIKDNKLKLLQLENEIKQNSLKVKSDSIELVNERNNFRIAQERFDRMEKLYQQGLKSKTDYESRALTLQSSRTNLQNLENKLQISINELRNSEIEYNSIQNILLEKQAKIQSELSAALSSKFDTEIEINKLSNQINILKVRQNYYYITAPQEGYITKTLKSGIGEIIKEGTEIVSIMPVNYNLLAELYVLPMDLPLIHKKQKVRLTFDGWPSIIFSGWPNSSIGTFAGKVYAIDNFISENGKYRVLIKPDKNEVDWPKQLRVGGGAVGLMLLNEVPVWYELWRQVNGFPPDYYIKNLPKE